MSKRPTSFAVSLRSDNVKALMLIKAIVNQNLDSVTDLINSVKTHKEKIEIIKSIKVQTTKNQEIRSDTEALFKLAAQNPDCDSEDEEIGVSENTKIKHLIEGFTSISTYSRIIDFDSVEPDKPKVVKKNARSFNEEVDILLSGLAFSDAYESSDCAGA